MAIPIAAAAAKPENNAPAHSPQLPQLSAVGQVGHPRKITATTPAISSRMSQSINCPFNSGRGRLRHFSLSRLLPLLLEKPAQAIAGRYSTVVPSRTDICSHVISKTVRVNEVTLNQPRQAERVRAGHPNLLLNNGLRRWVLSCTHERVAKNGQCADHTSQRCSAIGPQVRQPFEMRYGQGERRCHCNCPHLLKLDGPLERPKLPFQFRALQFVNDRRNPLQQCDTLWSNERIEDMPGFMLFHSAAPNVLTTKPYRCARGGDRPKSGKPASGSPLKQQPVFDIHASDSSTIPAGSYPMTSREPVTCPARTVCV